MAAITIAMPTLTVPDYERPIVILNRDPSRPPSSHSLRRSMSEESLNKITLPISREVPFFFTNMPPSPARTPPIDPLQQVEQTPTYLADRIVPVNVSIADLTQPATNESESSSANRDDVDEYIQQTADILSSTMKELQNMGLSEDGGAEDIIAANLRLLKTLKDRHAALDKVEHEVRQGRSRSSGPYQSMHRSIIFDTPGFTPPQNSRITFKDTARRNSDDMDGVSTFSVEWTKGKEERLIELQEKLKSANRNWSEDQNYYLEELEQLQEERRKHKKKLKMEKRSSVKMERSLSLSQERERRSSTSTSRERASSTENKRRRSLGFVPKPMVRTSSSNSFFDRIFRSK
ncbi:hypothetical protein Dda_3057 [Drechslerella dactyloides]|uniref:Uncharacterized protein n=1 Tax=Drechslerella dactyloides TaxID=74499 RepID=A0AAD6NL45_DREDA|nr:hypothetical protein Dda_3057 [Drechslerella dactyloides]